MDIPEKLIFINKVVEHVKMDINKQVAKMPEEWDEVELRWHIAEMFKERIVDPTAKHQHKARYEAYWNTVVTRRL